MAIKSVESREYGWEEGAEQVYSLFKELLIAKKDQRAVEERLLQVLSKPVHRKWMDERVLDQYKHEKMISDIAKDYLGREIKLECIRSTESLHGSLTHELFKRLEAVGSNIQFISNISQPIDDFKIYKMLGAMINDEHIYQNHLVIMLNDK